MKPASAAARGAASLLLLGALIARLGAEPLEAARAEELARTKAEEVAARNAALSAALSAVDAARAQLLPKLGATATTAYLFNPAEGLTVPAGSMGSIPLWVPASPNPSNPYAGPFIKHPIPLPSEDLSVFEGAKPWYVKGELSFSQPLFAWGKIRASIDLAAHEAEVAQVQARGASLDAGRQANRAYFSALLSRKSAALLGELRDLAAQIAADAASALAEGLSTREKLLSAQADLAELEARLVEASESERSSLEALALLTGIETRSTELVSDFRDTLPKSAEEGLKNEAPSSSTAFGEARARLAQARRKLDLERGSGPFRPDFSLFASLDAANQDASSMSSAFSWNLSVGLAAKADFFDGGAARAKKREASAKVDAAEAALHAALDGLRLEVRRAVDSGRRAEASLTAARAREAWAAEALKAARASAADQMISRSELNGARIREASARLSTLGARYALEEAIADLERLGMSPTRPRAASTKAQEEEAR
jgi:outer membrane protein TolC